MHVPAVPYAALRDERPGRDTASMAAEVAAARDVQRRRFAGAARVNASLTPAEASRHCALTPSAERVLEQAFATGRLPMGRSGGRRKFVRAQRLSRVARPIAPTRLDGDAATRSAADSSLSGPEIEIQELSSALTVRWTSRPDGTSWVLGGVR